jgi:hypothetical protein
LEGEEMVLVEKVMEMLVPDLVVVVLAEFTALTIVLAAQVQLELLLLNGKRIIL